MRHALMLMVFLLAACGAPSNDDGGGSGPGSGGGCQSDADCTRPRVCNVDSGTGKGTCLEPTPDGLFMCSTVNPCPDGQFCFNGLCAIGCLSNADCADNQYCDTEWSMRCLNKEVPGCSADTDCLSNQSCVSGLCSAAAEPEATCTPRPDGEDGCDSYAVCLDVSETDTEALACVSFPPCPEDKVCPVGQVGSVCNEGDLPGKAHMCLTGLCKGEPNCPASWSCLVPGGSTLGVCSDGSLGMPCLSGVDCRAGMSCMGAGGGTLGFCMSGGGASCAGAGGTCVDPLTGADCPAGTTVDGTKACGSITEMCCV